jgi:hypothetical protein
MSITPGEPARPSTLPGPQAATPKALPAKPKIGAGMAAPRAVNPATSEATTLLANGPWDPDVERARFLISQASQERTPRSQLANLNAAYCTARPQVQAAMRSNAAFKRIVNDAATDSVGRYLNGRQMGQPFDYGPLAGKEALGSLLSVAKTSHPDIAAALVVSAKPLFENHPASRGMFYSSMKDTWSEGKFVTSPQAHLNDLRSHVGKSGDETAEAAAIAAITALENSAYFKEP